MQKIFNPLLLEIPSSNTVLSEKSQLQTQLQKKIVLVGGTGRVGSSTAQYLAEQWPGASLVLAGRNREKGEELASQLGTETMFQHVDVDDMYSLARVLNGADLVVHSAGAFQRRKHCTVLEAAIRSKVPYIDVCDDMNHARAAKAYHERAVQAGVPAILTAGLCPGISNVMAAELLRQAKEASPSRPLELKYSYFIAGSGGAGPTVLATSFLLLKEQVVAYSKGLPVNLTPFSSKKVVDFGKRVGKRPVFLINVPEVATAHELLGVPTVSARYGSAPFFWNWIMAAITKQEFLNDLSEVEKFVELSDPAVRAIDHLVGGTVSMRVDLSFEDGRKAFGLYTHPQLSECAGRATAAFIDVILEGETQPGVWFPEQVEAVPIKFRKRLFERAAHGTLIFRLDC